MSRKMVTSNDEATSSSESQVHNGDNHYGGGGRGISVITLAGDNRGALLQIGKGSSTDDALVDVFRAYKLRHAKDATTAGTAPHRQESDDGVMGGTFLNNNVQGVNNSILYTSKCVSRDPGINMAINAQGSGHKAPRKEMQAIRVTPAPQKPVKRRCLRALFLESSDDEDGKKPIRHGCRLQCQALPNSSSL